MRRVAKLGQAGGEASAFGERVVDDTEDEPGAFRGNRDEAAAAQNVQKI